VLITKVFKSGNSQAIRIPKEYQILEDELAINKIGNTIIIFPQNDQWELFKKSLTEFSDDFFADGRNQPAMQLAAQSLSRNYTLVTNNTREFQRVKKLKLENWLQQP
jgi:antitoxin VapB